MSRTSPLLCLCLLFILVSKLSAQEIEIFKVSDFDLVGPVKTCLVITDYGKEEYHFDEKGRLTKSVTIYSESDYETTYYKYKDGYISERRIENYLDDTFDRATSLANFYTLETLPQRVVTEKIISYEKELLEQNRYYYNEDHKVIRMVRVGTDGTDEITFEYENTDEGEVLKQSLNGVLDKTVEINIVEIQNDSLGQKTEVSKNYINGELTSRNKKVINSKGKPLYTSSSIFDASTDKWIPQQEVTFEYTADGVLSKTTEKNKGSLSTKEYIYQFDGHLPKNWVKEIITPNNSYTTRKITYYKPDGTKIPEKKD
ncbi:hypothetical protein [Euzebyella saccharophila]|uniref:YD repeat-containing protein n=1 Tax=Euzebyella saccharophila TaxID=679664 RepID=A0ABV8JR71_9FLAO|nr:hypothetical protein [Euzebyella saccharophila]